MFVSIKEYFFAEFVVLYTIFIVYWEQSTKIKVGTCFFLE